jgi:succinoglycan biosynthesis protein ExoA
MSAAIDISVLVPVLNEGAQLRESVASMLAQELRGLTMELLLVDGGSDEETKRILAELAEGDPRIRLLENPARTTPVALNIALSHARGEYVARMDAHSRFPPCYLATGVERLCRDDAVEQVTGPMRPEGTGRWSGRVSLALETRLGIGGSGRWQAAVRDSFAETELDTGVFAGVWRRRTVDRLGGWDCGFPVNQDSELAARILERGGRIVSVSSMVATYLPRDGMGALARQYGRYGFYRAKTASRHPGSLRASHLLPPGLVLTAAAAVTAPKPLRATARAGVGLYAGAVVAESVRAQRRAPLHVAAGLPAVLVTMHVTWGIGFLLGAARFGGLRAIAREQLDSRLVAIDGSASSVVPAGSSTNGNHARRLRAATDERRLRPKG